MRWEEPRRTLGAGGTCYGFFFFPPWGKGRMGHSELGQLGKSWQELRTREMGCCGRRLGISMALSL